MPKCCRLVGLRRSNQRSLGSTFSAKKAGMVDASPKTVLAYVIRGVAERMPAFKGGVSRHSNGGYLKITAGPERDRLVHIVVAEGMLGRKLRKDEHVHHKDGNVKNPHWTNLLVVGKAVHNAVSNRQYWYLKRKFAREDAAWKAFFDVTGQTYAEYEQRETASIV